MKSIWQCSNELWSTIETKLSHAVVYADNACSELLHWNGGMNRFLSAGALDIRELSSFEAASKTQMKAVFILRSPLYDVGGQIIQDIIKASHFQYVIVVSTIGSHVHLYDKTGSTEGDEQSLMERFEEKLLQWMGNMNYTSEVMIVPVFTAEFSNTFFVTPAFSKLFPLLSTDVKRVELQYNSHCTNKTDRKIFNQLSDVENIHLPKNYLTTLKMFVSSLNGLFKQLDVREDIYYVGHTSRFLANELDMYTPARNRRKVAKEKACVLFIDRTLDLMTPINHDYDCLLDTIVNVLPRLPYHDNDALVDMTRLCSVHSEVDKTVIAPGSLAKNSSSTQSSILNSLLTSKIKEGLMDVNRHLVEAATSEKLPVKLSGKPGRVTAQQLYTTLDLFKSNYTAIQPHLDTLQVAMATANTLSDSKLIYHDNLVGMEKKLVQMSGDKDSPSILMELIKAMKTECNKSSSDRNFNLDDILSFLVFAYSLNGADFAEEEEAQFQEELMKAILEEKDNLPPHLKTIIGETVNKSIVLAIVEDLWCKLVSLGTARDDLDQFSSVLERGGVLSPTECKPLLKQIIEEIFKPDKPDLIDVKHKQSGMKDLLKSGFGLFMSMSKPRPTDHPLLLIFVVGGVTATEVKQIQDTVNKQKPGIQVVVGSTRLLQGEDVILSSLSSDNLIYDIS